MASIIKNIRIREHYYMWLINATKKLEKKIYGKPLLTTIRIGTEEYKMWIKEGLIEAQKTAKDNQETGAVYEFIMVECLKKLIKYLETPVFIDIGAYMGYYCCLAARLIKDSVVYGIESNQEYCFYIEKSIKENEYENVRIFNSILSDKIEILTSKGNTVVSPCEKDNKVKAVTFDILCQNNNIKPDILKIDVHGAEGKVIAGMKRMLKEQVKFVLLELHPDDYLKNYSMNIGRSEIFSIFFHAGFDLYFINGHRYLNFYDRKKYVRDKKVKAVLITKENQDALFVDRFTDVFILAMKKEIPINELDLLEVIP